MAEEKAQGSSGFWTSIPGMLAAVATLVTAVAGLLTVLKPSGNTAVVPPKPAVTGTLDIQSATPSVGPPLPLGQLVELAVSARSAVAAPAGAVFGVYLEEFPADDPKCAGPVHHMIPGKLVPAKAGGAAFKVTLRWERKAGDIYKGGGPADHGFLSVGANLWQDATGRAGSLVQAFGTTPAICIPYG